MTDVLFEALEAPELSLSQSEIEMGSNVGAHRILY